MQSIMPIPEECQHAHVRPDRFDEPGGIVCTRTRDWDGCGAEDGECARLHPSKTFCPGCLEQGYAGPDSRLVYDEEADVYGCNCCETMWWPDQLEDKWKELEQRLRDANKARMKEVA